MNSQPSTHRQSPTRRERGIVLPTVLIMIVLMTVVVLFLSRRGAVDERLASNVRGVVTMETAAQYALRWCELWLWVSPPGIAPAAGIPNPPLVMDAPASTAPSAWRSADWTAQAVTLPPDVLGTTANVTRAQCLIENARAELDVTKYDEGQAGLAFADTRRKYRLTSEVEGAGPDGLRFARSQSEVRMELN